jgi:SOS-response transcriptional repressor LexA
MNFEECLIRLRKYYKPSNAEIEKSLGLSNGYISKIKENPGKLLLVLSKNGISTDWFLTGKGEMFLSQPIGRPLQVEIPSLGIQIDQRLEKLEAQIAEIKGQVVEMGKQLREKDIDSPDSGLYVLEPEPEYGDGRVKTPFVDNIAAGPPIQQSEDLSGYINVPKRFIKTKPEDYYAARIRGESMTAAGIPDGCTVLIRRSDVPRDGAIQVVRREGSSTLKRMREDEDHTWTLHFEDNSERLIRIRKDEDYQVQGDFVAVLPEKD